MSEGDKSVDRAGLKSGVGSHEQNCPLLTGRQIDPLKMS